LYRRHRQRQRGPASNLGSNQLSSMANGGASLSWQRRRWPAASAVAIVGWRQSAGIGGENVAKISWRSRNRINVAKAYQRWQRSVSAGYQLAAYQRQLINQPISVSAQPLVSAYQRKQQRSNQLAKWQLILAIFGSVKAAFSLVCQYQSWRQRGISWQRQRSISISVISLPISAVASAASESVSWQHQHLGYQHQRQRQLAAISVSSAQHGWPCGLQRKLAYHQRQ